MNTELRQRLRVVRVRQRWAAALNTATWGLLLGAIVAMAVAIWVRTPSFEALGWQLATWQVLLVTIGCPLCGLLIGLICRRDWLEAAHAVDASCQLKDRATTAVEFAATETPSDLQ